MSSKKDNKLMAVLSVWGIFLVVLGHSGMAEAEIEPHVWALKEWIYSFHMPLFFFISGYLYSLTTPDSKQIHVLQFIGKKTKRLIIPYLFWGCFSIILNTPNLKHLDWNQSFLHFIYPHELGFLWFLATLFIIFSFFIILEKTSLDYKKPIMLWGLITIFLFVSYILPTIQFFNLSEAFYYITFFLIGIYIQKNNGLIECLSAPKLLMKVLNNPHLKFVIWGGNILAVDCLLVFLPIHSSNNSILFFATWLASIVGILFSIILCTELLHLNFCKRYLLPLSYYTFSIYLLSKFGQIPIRHIGLHSLPWYLCVTVMCLGGLLIPIIACKMITKINILKDCKLVRLIIGY